ncbi:DUF4012 domain-containing protein [Cryobacterium sp. CG_9.6]|uniref:DUF4012 domain-containing protein n=1 Tax=Cryobacterium sp. CG_9.6 TaxID=2760710 RepID=UPI002472F09E|nr:DUF4012 domain-containing protein [Cryobacterium sp. CG_9.6]MDH6235817.1 hypothetical protein [Cryobacterium sp. CG_9.6]
MKPSAVGGPGEKSRSVGRVVAVRVMLAVLAIVLLGTAWVGVRAVMARDELQSAVPLAEKIRSDVVSGNSQAASQTVAELAPHAARAVSLTSDPVWRAFETVPVLGTNLSAVRGVAAIVDSLVLDAVQPLIEAASGVNVADFAPVNGAVNLQPLLAVQPQIAAANVALARARTDVGLINAAHTLAPVRDAVAQLETVVVDAAGSVDALDRASRLLPRMLGDSGPRNYLLLVQNPGELRATGGVSGAMALIHTENGAITLTQQASTEDFTPAAEPVLPLPAETTAIYGEVTGRFIQSANLTPRFALTGALAREMWRLRYGLTVDGVLTVDPATLGYLLAATGPITVPSGEVLTADNAVQVLTRDAYARYPEPARQDAFFAAAAGAVFTALSAGQSDPVKLVAAVARGGDEGRVLVWSADKADQNVLSGTTLAGGLPVSDARAARFGIYLNDATGGKMGTYLGVKAALGQQTCGAPGRPSYRVSITLTNTAPLDAKTSRPSRITTFGEYGVTPGNVKTILSVYGVTGMTDLGLTRDGQPVDHNQSTDGGYPVTTVGVELVPGESAVLNFGYLGDEEFDGTLLAVGTPIITSQTPTMLTSICD